MTPLDKLTLCEQLQHSIGRALWMTHEMTFEHLMIVVRLGERRLMVTKLDHEGVYYGSNNSYALALLARRGWLRKESVPTDARRVYVSLTPRGLAIREELLAVIDREMPKLLAQHGVDLVEVPQKVQAA
jgi:DNA-binding MarR family transcriptional regulator